MEKLVTMPGCRDCDSLVQYAERAFGVGEHEYRTILEELARHRRWDHPQLEREDDDDRP